MKIEHWHSQERYHGEQLTYSNLLGSCMGGDGQRDSVKDCDSAKRSTDLSRNPANRIIMSKNRSAILRMEGSHLRTPRLTASSTRS